MPNSWFLRALGLLALLGLAACDQQQQTQAGPPTQALPVTVAKPVAREIVNWDEYTGRFAAVDFVEIRARVSGYLEKVHFTDGEMVQEGDLLFTIDQRPFRIALEQAQADLKQAEARLTFATKELERAGPLLERGNIAQSAFDERLEARNEAAAAVEALRAAVNNARLNLEFTEVKAPVAGRTSRHLVSIGNLISSGADATLLTTIVSFDPIYFYFDVSERDLLRYLRLFDGVMGMNNQEIGTPVMLSLADEEGFKHEGRLDFVDNRIDDATGTIRGRAVLENPGLGFVPGLFARIRLAASAPYDALLVPDEIVGTDQARKFVYVVKDDDTVEYRTVQLGQLVDGLRVVREGLQADDRVIINGLQRARPGAPVVPQEGTIAPAQSASAVSGTAQ